ncbi:hypothetical protein Pint_27335 [Pistacia integerrima]|uniref:Uncharacterized protein n=1 Tax=Pistacia integerrima TaxID=434235 RepID=A0ACC0YN39_9ROSI|nr:hypothetical protein Pint_27335 [Pistacia integerrima]
MEKRQQELQFLGFFGIFNESLKLIFSKPKLFTQITLTFILPLSIVSQLHKYFSYTIASKRLSYSILLEFSYYLVIFIPSLLSTSAVVCAITFLYAEKNVTFKNIRGVLRKIWKRVMITVALGLAIDFCSKKLLVRVGILIDRHFMFHQVYPIDILTTRNVIGVTLNFLNIAIVDYISIIQNLAKVVSVIEDLSGIQAMIKSNNLIEGKIGVAVLMFIAFGSCFIVINGRIYSVFLELYGGHLNWRNGVGIGIPFLILLESMVTLLALVVGAIMYFSCKSREITMRVLSTQKSFKSIEWSVLDPLIE